MKTKESTITSLYAALWRLLKPDVRGHVRALMAAYATSLGGIGAVFCGPYLLAAMLDNVLPSRNLKLFYLYAGAILLSLVVLFVFSFLKTYLLGRSSERIFLSLRTRIASSVTKKPARFFFEHETGDLITRVSNDTESLSVLVFDYIYASLNGVTMIVVFVALMLAWEWRLGLYTALSLPCYVALLALFQKPLSAAAAAARRKLSEQNETTLDILSGVKEIRFYQQSLDANQRFAAAAGLFTTANIRSVLIGEWAFNAMEMFSRLIALFPFLLGGYWICQGSETVTVGTLVAYNLYLTYIAYSLEVANVGMTKLAQASPLITRIQEIIDFPEEEIVSPAGITDVMESTRIEYRKVCFSHVTGKPVLRDFCLTIEPGEKIAVMGPSGAGKSTLIDLLTRHIEPDRGEILFDGRPVNKYNLPLYLQNFAYVQQKPYIFRTSVRENIAAGWYHVPIDIIVNAATRVRIHEAIVRMPSGYDTVIGPGGADLSGGQRQRLALARALVRDPEILLLDEFTSALDQATEEAILDDLFATFRKQTIICVTHSQAVANRFARIVRIEKV